MKIENLRALCGGHSDLERVLLGDNYNNTARGIDINKDEALARLVNTVGEERIRLFGLLVGSVNRAYQGSGSLRSHASSLSNKLRSLSRKVRDESVKRILAGLVKSKEKEKKEKGPAPTHAALLERMSCPLSEIGRVGRELSQNNYALSKSCLEALKTRTIHHFVHPADSSNAHTATLSPQPVTIASLPKNIEEVKNYFEALTKQGCRVFVSLHESRDGSASKPSRFWENDVLSQIRFSDGRTIRKVSERELARGVAATRVEDPTLIESTLELSDGTRITHIHYTAWVDRTACPDTALLERLHDRIEELSPDASKTVAFNCHGGVGRSGVAATSYAMRKHLSIAAEHGERLDEMQINIFDTIACVRQYREKAIANAQHVPTLCDMLSRYYRRFTAPEFLWRNIVPSSALRNVA